eukprot:2363707-Amphidinium_carterae.1
MMIEVLTVQPGKRNHGASQGWSGGVRPVEHWCLETQPFIDHCFTSRACQQNNCLSYHRLSFQ